MAPAGPGERLAALGRQSGDIPALDAAIAFAGLLRPGTAAAAVRRRVAALGGELAARVASDDPFERRVAALLALLAEVSPLAADESGPGDLIGFLDGLGGAGARALLAAGLARRAGLAAEILAFPAVWLLRLDDRRGRRGIVDPVAGPAPLDPPSLRALLKAARGLAAELTPPLVAAANGRALALRHGAELKFALLRHGRLAEALALVEGMLPLAPDDDRLWREAGMMHLRLDHPAQAVAALDQYLTRARDPGQRVHATRLVAELRGRLPDVLPGRTE